MTEKDVTVEIVRGPDGDALYIDNHRVAGPKPIGGGKIVREWKVKLSELRIALGIPAPKENSRD